MHLKSMIAARAVRAVPTIINKDFIQVKLCDVIKRRLPKKMALRLIKNFSLNSNK